jgi:hypothetical protein
VEKAEMLHRIGMSRAWILALSLGFTTWAITNVGAGVYKTQKQALAEAFPGGFDQRTVFLTDAQVQEVEKRARAKVESKIITFYTGRDSEGRPAGAAYFDTHIVRTTTETVLVVLDPDGAIRRVEILAFYEPEDYKVRQGWLDRMEEKDVDDEMAVGRDLVRVTGATLTVHALAATVRRVLALNEVLSGVSKS